ncbi:MAG: hypothetical protein R6X25_15275 [Candidatus Krumholzibacteriia bacterium]
MPLTAFQATIGRLLAANRSEDSYLAGVAAMLAAPNTTRYSHDLDDFHDSAERVAAAFAADRETLGSAQYEVDIELSQPGYVRAIVRKGADAAKIEWAQDSTWRFMPVVKSEEFGYQLHPVDLATNKVLALAGRDELRVLLDTLYTCMTTCSRSVRWSGRPWARTPATRCFRFWKCSVVGAACVLRN